MPALAEFQAEFAAAVLHPDSPLPQSFTSRAQGTGFAVYQNTVMRGLIDALRANYPTVVQLVGTEWFDGVARLYAIEHLPSEPSLAVYGEHFAAFLQPLAAAHELHYLPYVAQLDHHWLQAQFAAEASALTASDLQHYAPEQLSALRLPLHPATRYNWLPHSAVTIWQANQPQAHRSSDLQVSGTEEGVLITRVHSEIAVAGIDHAHWLFMEQLQHGLTLGDAALQVLQQHAETDIAAMLARLITAGAFMAKEGLINLISVIPAKAGIQLNDCFTGCPPARA